MKRYLSMGIAILLSALVLAGCNKTTTSSSTVSSTSTASSASVSSSVSSSTSVVSSVDVASMLESLTTAAELGATISMSELDLKATGLHMDSIVNWAGAQSQQVAQNGGTVIVLEVKDGKTDEVVGILEKYRDLLANDDRYQDYAIALKNISEARIIAKNNVVIYAVSATGQDGGYSLVDAAIDTLLA